MAHANETWLQTYMMASFLTLPLEIRLAIIRLVVYDEREKPMGYTSKSGRQRVKGRRYQRGWQDGHGTYSIPDQSHYTPNVNAFLETNQQLQNEAKSIFRTSEPLFYKLDLLIMQGRELWPTWTSIPRKARTVDEVSVQVRLAGSGPWCGRAYLPGDASPPPGLWWFYGVLERFVKEGPSGSERYEQVDAVIRPKIAARVLDLDFLADTTSASQNTGFAGNQSVSSQESNAAKPLSCPYCKRKCLARLEPFQGCGSLNHEYVFMFLTSGINSLLTNASLFSWGEILYRAVGIVRFRLRGKLKAEFDLAQMLASMPVDYIPNVENQVQSITSMRASFGLNHKERMPANNHEEWLDSIPWRRQGRQDLIGNDPDDDEV